MKKLLLFLFAVILLSSGCRLLRPDIMLRTPKDYVYSPVKDSSSIKESKLTPNDIIEFRLYSNDGFKLIDLTALTGGSAINLSMTALSYLLELDGTVKLPVLGYVKVGGLTLREAETMLEGKYAQYYVKPYILLKVTNKRVIVFPGSGATAHVLTLTNNNTTLIEAIALSGGLPEYAKAYKIKVIRGDPQKPTVYLMDLSKIDGVAQANMVVQANDIIYVEPRIRLTSEVLKEVTPILTLLTSAFLVYSIVLQAKR
jgi:polysaccharide export outer membrane protein